MKQGLAIWIVVLASSACAIGPEISSPQPGSTQSWCDALPRKINLNFERIDVDTDWFQVYRVDDGVFALVEPKQFQETVAYLILGSERGLMFDTGLGMSPIRGVVEQLTDLPITGVNSHTHYDHVGGNGEFDHVLAVDSAYTRANQRGFPHSELAGEVAAASFCGGPPEGLDTDSFHTRPWTSSGINSDEDELELGGRVLEILHIPGHTPYALAMLDRENGLLWTGDTFYDATIWLYVPETDLDQYERSLERLGEFSSSSRRLLPAHNTVSAEPAHLLAASRAIRQVREGLVNGVEQSSRLPFLSLFDSDFKTASRGAHRRSVDWRLRLGDVALRRLLGALFRPSSSARSLLTIVGLARNFMIGGL